MERPPIPINIADSSGYVNLPWIRWFETLNGKFNRSGTTANRPKTNVEIGDQYFDSTLGYPIWARSINPIVWVKYNGLVV